MERGKEAGRQWEETLCRGPATMVTFRPETLRPYFSVCLPRGAIIPADSNCSTLSSQWVTGKSGIGGGGLEMVFSRGRYTISRELMRSAPSLRTEHSVTSLIYKHDFLIPWLRGMNRFITSPMPRFPLVKMATDTLV